MQWIRPATQVICSTKCLGRNSIYSRKPRRQALQRLTVSYFCFYIYIYILCESTNYIIQLIHYLSDHWSICFEVVLLLSSLCRGGGWTVQEANTKCALFRQPNLSNSSPIELKTQGWYAILHDCWLHPWLCRYSLDSKTIWYVLCSLIVVHKENFPYFQVSCVEHSSQQAIISFPVST
jgi:hypothetical protein